MVGIKHSVVTAKANNAAYDVSATAWNAEHSAGAIADVLTDHNKAAHDALGINADLVDGSHAAAFEAAGAASTHSALTTGVHGVGAGTVAKVTDITDANLITTDVATNDASTAKHGFLKKLDNENTHFMRGDGTWAVPAGASGAPGAYSYLIKINGADCEAYNTKGTLAFGGAADAGGVDGANHDAVIIAAVAALPTAHERVGKLFFLNGTYNIDADITIGKKTEVIGESSTGVIFNVTGNLTNGLFCIDAEAGIYSSWKFSNFYVDMNQYNGNVFYSTGACHSGGRYCHRIQDINAEDIKAGYSFIDLTNLYAIIISNLRIRTYGNGIVIRRSVEGMNFGNSVVEQIYISLLGNNGVAIDIIGASGENKAFNLAVWNMIHIYESSSETLTGTVGLRITNDADMVFNELDIEHATSAIYLDGVLRAQFNNSFIYDTRAADHDAIYLVNTCYGNSFQGGTVNVGDHADAYAYRDASSGSGARKNRVGGGINLQYRWNLGTNTLLDGLSYLYNITVGGSAKSQNKGASTGTGSQQTIAHGLGTTPVYVLLTNLEDGANPYLSAATDATNIYVTAVSGKDYTWAAYITA